jgi:CRISPR-associated protein Cas2
MLVLVTYDVQTTTPEGRRRLRKVANACRDYGVRVQLSVFECQVDPAQWVTLRARLLKLLDPSHDSIRFYMLGSGAKRIEHYGRSRPIDVDGPLIL